MTRAWGGERQAAAESGRLLSRTIQVRKPKPELLDTRVKPEEWAEALELQLRSSGTGASDALELPGEPLFSATAQPSWAPPCPTPRGPFAFGSREPPCALEFFWALPGSSAVGRLAAPRLPALPSALPRSRLSAAQRSAAPPAAALQTPPPPPQGAPGPRRKPKPGYAGAPGLESLTQTRRRHGARSPRAGRGAAPRAWNTQTVLPRHRARGPQEASRGLRPGCCRRAPNRPCPRAEHSRSPPPHPAGSLPESARGPRQCRRERLRPAGTSPEGPGAAPPRSARTLRARPAAVQRGAARLGRSSGAVPAPSGSAPHTCLCPAPGDVAPSDWPTGGAEAGELTAAPRHWPGRRTRAVAGRRRYPEPESFQLRCVELSGSRRAGLSRPGRAGPRGRRNTWAARRQRAGAVAVLPEFE